ncbi:hypothetical protein, conserved [Eimeria praecox]|uniref:Transmembrane protein n=1 Tax=Eimeria praecox TaxID=51316 RepID=U6G840_9EIME|nr:hypothetical protein, conserved [Eimeria praecox]
MVGVSNDPAPHVELPAAAAVKADGIEPNDRIDDVQDGFLHPEFVRLRLGRRARLSGLLIVAVAGLVCTALAYMIVSCSLAVGPLSSSSKPIRLLSAEQGDICSTEGGGAEEAAEEEKGTPPLPLPQPEAGERLGGEEAGPVRPEGADTGGGAAGERRPLPPLPPRGDAVIRTGGDQLGPVPTVRLTFSQQQALRIWDFILRQQKRETKS